MVAAKRRALCCVAVAASSASPAAAASSQFHVTRRDARQAEQEYYRRISAAGGDNEEPIGRDNSRPRRRAQISHKKENKYENSAALLLHHKGNDEEEDGKGSMTFVSTGGNTASATTEASSSGTSTIKNLKNLRATDLRSFQDLRLGGASFIPEEEDRYRYMASLQMEGINPAGTHYDYHICGGILVAPDFILTSAHCAYYSPPNSNEKYPAFNGIEVGKTDLSYEGLDYDAYSLETYKLYYENLIPEKRYLHSDYNEETYEHDIMLVKTYGKSRYPVIRINSHDDAPKRNEDITVLGWGAEHDDSVPRYSNLLKEADLKAMTNDQCKASAVDVTNPETGRTELMSLRGHISDDMMCAKATNRYICHGDAGGPVIRRADTGRMMDTICADSTAPPEQYDCPNMVSMSSSASTQTVTLKMKLDMMSVETGFVIRFRDTAEVVAQRIPGYYKEDHNLVMEEEMELPLINSFGDGNCCDMGGGNSYLYKGTDTSIYTGELLAEINGNFEFNSSADFCTDGQVSSNPPTSTPPPTPSPITPIPTDAPAGSQDTAVGNIGWSGPVSSPEFAYCTDFCVSNANALRCGQHTCIPASASEPIQIGEVSDEHYLTVQFEFDDHPEEHEVKVFVDFGVYHQEGFANQKLNILVDVNGPDAGEAEYAFTVYDKESNGLCCTAGEGLYKVWFGDEVDGQLLFGDDAYEFSSSYVFTLFEEPSLASTPLPTTSSPTPEPSPGPTTNKPTLSPIRGPTNIPTTSPTDSPTHIWEIQRTETSDAIGMRWSALANTPPGEFNDVGGNQQQYAFNVDGAANSNGATRNQHCTLDDLPDIWKTTTSTMDQKESSRRSSKQKKGSSSSRENASDNERDGADITDKYASEILESQGRLDKYTAENDHLLDEVSNLRLQIREMKNDRSELVRAHHESMSLLAQVSEEKLVEFKSKSELEALESKSAQEEALRTVLEMMEKDCEDRVAELDAELARVETDRERAIRLQLEAAAKAAEESARKQEAAEAIAEIDESAESSTTPLVESKRPPVVSRRGIKTYQESPFLDDPFNDMTYGRRIALKLQNYSWYQPRGTHWDFNGLGLQSAWAHFEHSVLPRYISKALASRKNASVGLDDDDDWLYSPGQNKGSQERKGDLQRAEPGESESPTKLYSTLSTPLSQMGDFGLGVGLYFSSLRAIALISLVAGLINLPNILYFASDVYSANQPDVNFLLKGSALCTEQVWVPCPTCPIDKYENSRDRIAGTTTVTPDGELQTLMFAMKNTCDGATMNVGIVNLATLGFIVLATIALSAYQKRKVDATEPEEWKKFFESRFGVHTTCCTVTIDNDLLVKALAERREVLHQIEEKIKEGAAANTLSLSEYAAKVEHRRGLIGYIKSGTAKLPSYKVFCTFETESMQRDIISEMKVGPMTAHMNSVHAINPNLLFRGEIVLDVREAEEPSTIRWMDLDVSWSNKMKQLSVTTLISLAFVVAVAVIVALVRLHGAAYAALAISIANSLFPIVAKILTNVEAHASETGKQCSLFVKIAIFRWVVTAIVITIITPFTSTLTRGPDHLLQSIWLIFFTDLVTSNVLQISDPVGNFKRHFLAPRAKSQERMNLLMSGTEYTIAERFTNMTKQLFLTFYYCAIYPSIFFICAVTLFINFYVDKFSIMRMWKPAPMVGASIAKFSRVYFMTTSVAALAIVSSYWLSGFPYDNLCADNISHSAYYGNWQVTDGNGQTSSAVLSQTSARITSATNTLFPVSPDAQPSGSKWMTSSQEQLVGIYGIVSAVVLGLVCAVFAYRILDFKSEQFTYPLLAVNVDYVGESIFDWSDPARSHSYYDLTRDVEQLLKGDENEETCYRAFGQIRHWPPNGPDAVEVGEKPRRRSSLRRSKESAYKRNVSWSSKVTCKTYSKDVPMTHESFNANASTNQGMNFDGHAAPIFDPHTQNEARGFGKQNEGEAPPQVSPPQHFDQYHNTGVDQANQQTDPFYGESQNHENSLQTGGSSSTSSAYADNSSEGSDSGDSEEDYGGSFSEESQTTAGTSASEGSRHIT
ncbi:trypsin-like serine protease [Skeletonema marinoi]|uniref:Trypsin-like serine protease n=1 Tax=Skeletonema marinoi TaxID=267567 RepID=A0AAD9DGJ4_9STRA|nr:trypsin-like serine protease [Skeletonema marinoi]